MLTDGYSLSLAILGFTIQSALETFETGDILSWISVQNEYQDGLSLGISQTLADYWKSFEYIANSAKCTDMTLWRFDPNYLKQYYPSELARYHYKQFTTLYPQFHWIVLGFNIKEDLKAYNKGPSLLSRHSQNAGVYLIMINGTYVPNQEFLKNKYKLFSFY